MAEEPWYRRDCELLTASVSEAIKLQPGLRLRDEGGFVGLEGRFDIDHEGQVVEAFSVRIQIAIESPRHPPAVWETGGRIPRVPDPHHVNLRDDSLCVQLEEAYWFHYPQGLSLAEFLENPLRRHLAGQATVLRGGQWPDEWSHGDSGRWEFYREVLETSDPDTLVRLMGRACRPLTKTYLPCPCGSGRKLRKCHGPTLHKLQQAPSFEWVRSQFVSPLDASLPHRAAVR